MTLTLERTTQVELPPGSLVTAIIDGSKEVRAGRANPIYRSRPAHIKHGGSHSVIEPCQTLVRQTAAFHASIRISSKLAVAMIPCSGRRHIGRRGCLRFHESGRAFANCNGHRPTEGREVRGPAGHGASACRRPPRRDHMREHMREHMRDQSPKAAPQTPGGRRRPRRHAPRVWGSSAVCSVQLSV